MTSITMLHTIVFNALLLASCGYALWRGAAPERAAAAIMLAATLATVAALRAGPNRFATVETGVFAVDIVTFVAFTALALRAQRYWPMWLAALQLDALVTHLAMLLAPRTMPWAYAVLIAGWSYPSLLLLAAGTMRHRQRLSRYGDDPAWSPLL
jgi:hypothetical protein